MTDEQIKDLKQFMTTLVMKQTAFQANAIKDELREEIREGFAKLDKKLSGKIDDLSKYIGEALNTSNDENGKQLKNHERRINILEAKIA